MGIFADEIKASLPSIVNKIKSSNSILYKTVTAQHKAIFDLIWNNSDHTPAEIVKEFGTDAVALFTLSENLQAVFKEADPNYVVLTPKYEITPNEDGSITVGDIINAK